MSDLSQQSSSAERSVHRHPHGENTLLWTVWLTYGAFYFCRTNISAAVPGLKASVEAGGLGLSATEISYILGGTKIAYALGQLLNGQFSEQLAPRKLLAIGMLQARELGMDRAVLLHLVPSGIKLRTGDWPVLWAQVMQIVSGWDVLTPPLSTQEPLFLECCPPLARF